MNTKIEGRKAIKTLKYYKSVGKKILKNIRKKRKNDQSYSKLERDIQKWYKNLCRYLRSIFSDKNDIVMNIVFPITGINFSKEKYIDTIEMVLNEIDRKIISLPSARKSGNSIMKVSIVAAVSFIAAIIVIVSFFKDSLINKLKSEKKELQAKKRSLDNRSQTLVDILKLIESKPKNNKLLKQKKGKPVKILDGEVSLSLKEMTLEERKVRIEMGNVLFEESLRNVDVIGLYEKKSFKFKGKKYFVYVIEIKQDFVLIFVGEHI